jgi:hypothetical protein
VANAWNALPITATLQGVTAYWLMYNTNGSSQQVNNLVYNDAAQGLGAYSQDPFSFGTWPVSFPTAVMSTAQYSIFATFVP